jgi:thiosulfate reductase cytochrome b subunit
MAEFILGIWRALTAAGRSLALGTIEAWGFWSTTLLLLCVVFFAVHLAGGVFWRFIEGRLRPKVASPEALAQLRRIVRDLKADLYDAQQEQARLAAENAELTRVVEANRNWSRNWNADAGRVAAGAAR